MAKPFLKMASQKAQHSDMREGENWVGDGI